MVIAAPPLDEGALKATLTWVSPAVGVPITGAPGATAFTVNDWLIVDAGKKLELPVWSALTVQVPALINVSTPVLVTVHTPVVEDVNVGASPESDVAANVGLVPKFRAPGFTNVMVCVAAGVTELEAADAAPVPAEVVAVTVKV